MLRLSFALFLVSAGFHGFTATIPLALSRAGRTDAEIGAIVGIAPLVQVPAALAGGALIDRFGGIRLFVVGAICYLLATVLLYAGGVTGEGSAATLAVARALQGVAFGLTVPAALSIVPRLVSVVRRGLALATAGAFNNLTLVVLPPLSIIVLDAYGLEGVALMVLAFVVAAIVLVLARPLRYVAAPEPHLTDARRRLGFAYRASWTAPLAMTVLFVIHWGVLMAYLPQRAEAAGANVGLFFAADGLFVLLGRVPSGWLADRTRALWLILVGIGMTATAVAMLVVTPTTPVLVVAGALTGAGAALFFTPLLLVISQRSTDADRGSAFAISSAALAGAIAIGTIGTAPLIEVVGFVGILSAAFVALLASAVVALADRGLRSPPARAAHDSPASEPLPVGEP